MSEYSPHYKTGFKTIMRSFVHTAFDFKVHGVENLIDPPYLLVSNHLHHADTPSFATAIPHKIYGVGAKKIEHTLIGRLFSLGAVIWLEQDSADTSALKEMMKVIRAGHTLALYPEGHRSKQPGMQKAKDGATFIATRRNIPIVPASITGTHLFMKRFRPEVNLTIGEPFTLPKGKASDEELAFYTEYMMCCVASLLPDEYHGYYVDNPLIEEIKQHGNQFIDTVIADEGLRAQYIQSK